MKIHHNTLKRAAAHGLTFSDDNATEGKPFAVFKDGTKLAEAATAKDALDLAVLELAPAKPTKAKASKPKKPAKRKTKKSAEYEDGDDEQDPDGEDEGSNKSVIKAKYKTKYRSHKMTCGDTLAKQVREAFMTQKDPDTGKPRLDFARFVKFAQANDVWVEGYRSLKNRHGKRNNGMIRMNVINRLRAKLRKDKDFKIEWGV